MKKTCVIGEGDKQQLAGKLIAEFFPAKVSRSGVAWCCDASFQETRLQLHGVEGYSCTDPLPLAF
jgi:hypothetical protein